MSSVSGIRLPGLATGMDTENMVKEMLTGEQNKIDKIKQKEQSIKWQQEIYREIINDVKSLNDKYFSVTSKNSIISSGAWSTLTVNSSNENVITATAGAGANDVNYSFDVKKLAQSAKITSSVSIDDGVKTNLKDLGLKSDVEFRIALGKDKDGNEIYSDPISIKVNDSTEIDENGNPKYKADTIDSLVKKINDASKGEVKASFSEMTGSFSIESVKTGSDSSFKIVDKDGNNSTDLNFLGLKTNEVEINKDGSFTSKSIDFNGTSVGSDSIVEVKSKDGSFSKILNEKTNSFTIDGIKYDVHATGTSDITSKQDVKPVVENMKAFVEDYNKIMDKMYDIVTQKINRDYPPLTEAQKEDMSEEEIERWEKKSKQGILRNDSEMRRFMEDMQKSIFGDKMEMLNSMGLTSHENYNKKGQIALNEEKFVKALQNNSDEVYEMFAKDEKSVLENMKSTINKYIGGSSSVFAKKAGLEKTASAVKNFYSEQLKRQEDAIKKLQRKMDEKEDQLYKKFGSLEASMNKLNSQMNYFMQA